jgi:large subunit ribosomal protein L9
VAKQASDIKRARAARSVRDLTHAQEIATALKALTVTLPARAGKEGRLFGSVTTADIVAAVSTAGGPALDKRTVEIPSPIKGLGSHQVLVRLHGEVSSSLQVEVVGTD